MEFHLIFSVNGDTHYKLLAAEDRGEAMFHAMAYAKSGVVITGKSGNESFYPAHAIDSVTVVERK